METLNNITVIFLTGLVIKLMDDYLDQELDRMNGRQTLAMRLDRGTLPYALILLTFAVLIDYQLAIALFWSSYIVGMGMDTNRLPTGLKSYQEVMIMVVFGFLVLDYNLFLFSISIITFVQLSDDYIDYYLEEYINRDNFINYLGKVGTILLATIALVISLTIDWQMSILVALIANIVVWILHR
ncbi:hypothetical protein BX659_12537 [Orenia metallireducens]|uniref:Uncharacterized protein n=1 Tax=Orenia metallireducens TaxID=1413210 RepID=A0A285HT67_9FIRM|nr:hypothetical protein [Orenia metallireducens]PRX24074.1 hypothetical protein BX659_12537 [Orenia metallireducens]SNY38892.1 hypothetical protein SAMN06265827_12438 [Orenia metallireducens]